MARAVRAERSRQGLTQAELAQRLGWTRDRVSMVERMAAAIALDELPGLCRGLGVPLSRLLVEADREDVEALDLGY